MKIKKYYKYIFIIFFLFLGSIIGYSRISAINTMSTGYKVPNGSVNYPIQYPQVPLVDPGCGYVDNSSGYSIFVPTKTLGEWDSLGGTGVDGCDNSGAANAGFTGWESVTVCGSWDWNCDGVVTKRYTDSSSDTDCSFVNWSCDSGWSGSAPNCGVSDFRLNGDCWVDPVPIPVDITFCEGSTVTQSCH